MAEEGRDDGAVVLAKVVVWVVVWVVVLLGAEGVKLGMPKKLMVAGIVTLSRVTSTLKFQEKEVKSIAVNCQPPGVLIWEICLRKLCVVYVTINKMTIATPIVLFRRYLKIRIKIIFWMMMLTI